MPEDKTFLDPEERFARREGRRDDLRRYVDILIDELLELRQETDPSGGEETSELKDIHALDALDTAGRLVVSLAGWAIAHNLGRASRGLEFTPLAPSRVKSHPEYADQRAAADSHENERKGQLISGNAEALGDITKERLALIDLLQANPGGFPRDLAWRLAEALKALEFGDTHSLLEPKKTGLTKPAYARMALELRALEFVEFRAGQGIKKYRATEQVAKAFGCSVPTVNSWGKTLRQRFGEIEVRSRLRFAYNAGSYLAPATRHLISPRIVAHHAETYNDSALSNAGKEYRAVLRNRA